MKKYGVGIVGTGAITGKQIEAVNGLTNAEVLALFNPNPESAKRAEEKFQMKVDTDMDQFLSTPGMDIVCICSPSGHHLIPSIAAAKAGKHLVIEKPIEVTLSRSDELAKVAEENNVRLEVIFQNRFSEDYQKIVEGVRNGSFGKLLLVNAHINWYRSEEYYAGSQYKGTIEGDGGGALINQAIHTLDLMLNITGDVKSVNAKVKTSFHDIEAEDLAMAMVEFKSGALGSITAATALYPGYPERLEVFGSKGSAILEGGKLIAWNIKGERPLEIKDEAEGSGAADPMAIGHQLHQAQWKEFLEALDSGKPNNVDAKMARKSVELIRGIYLSSRQNKTIEFPFID